MKKIVKHISTFLYNLLLSIPLTLATAVALLAYSATIEIPGCSAILCRLEALKIPGFGTPIALFVYLVIFNVLRFIGYEAPEESKSKLKKIFSKIYLVLEMGALVLSLIIVILIVYFAVNGYLYFS